MLYNVLVGHYTVMGGDTMSSKPIKPGTDNQPAGKYKEVGPRGGAVPKPREVKIDRCDRLPPTQKPGNGWVKKP